MNNEHWEIPPQNYTGYLQACRDACDQKSFNTFRQNAAYRAILEHTNPVQAGQYYDWCITKEPSLLTEHFKEFQKNDLYGSPDLMNTSYGKICPSTLRYIKNTLEIKRQFNYRSVIEIGGGYGGLCRALSVFGWSTYDIIDLKDPLALAKTYLDKYELNVSYHEPTPTLSADLLISNYALSECDEYLQTEYFYNVIKNCKNCYITHNTTYKPFYQTFLKMCEPIFNIEIIDEPISDTNSKILFMKRKDNGN